jgi:MoaA/NifB/PqqE/SkfB family radical SAM enzyme
MDLGALADRLQKLRFDYHRSFRRVSARQLRRLVRDRYERPASCHPRRLASIGLTHRCQKRCEWCATGAYRHDQRGEMTTAEVERLLRDLVASRHVFHNVSFVGGECLLRPDQVHLVRYATDLGLLLHLSTNGLKLDARMASALVEAGLNSVFVAWELNQPLGARQEREQERVQQNVRQCVAQGLPCFLSVCVCREQVFGGQIERTLELARGLGVAGVRIFPVRLAGQWLWEDSGRILDEREMEQLRGLCRSGFAFLTDDAARSAGRSCAAQAGSIIYVSPYGELQPCHFFPFSFGNLRRTDLDSALDRMWSHPMLQVPCDDCLLHDRQFRAQQLPTLPPGARLPKDLVVSA